MGRLGSFVLIAALCVPGPAAAIEAGEIVAQLRAQGFAQIRVSHTFLGRVRIEAQSPRLHREIVLNPKTGEILRDYTEDGGDGSRFAGAPAGGDTAVSTGSGGLTAPSGVGSATAGDGGPPGVGATTGPTTGPTTGTGGHAGGGGGAPSNPGAAE